MGVLKGCCAFETLELLAQWQRDKTKNIFIYRNTAVRNLISRIIIIIIIIIWLPSSLKSQNMYKSSNKTLKNIVVLQNKCDTKIFYSFIDCTVLRQIRAFLQCRFPRQCHFVFPISN
jgi:hypothetical protein